MSERSQSAPQGKRETIMTPNKSTANVDQMNEEQSEIGPVHHLLAMLDSEDLEDRLAAIQALGILGDPYALSGLQNHLRIVNREMEALLIVISQLKNR